MNYTWKFPSDIKRVNEFTSQIIEKLETSGVSQEPLFDIRLAMDEALINAIKYGNKMHPDIPVEVNISTDGKKIEIEIKDMGEGFDCADLPDPTDPNNLDKTSGRGVFLIRNVMDRVDFLDGGSRLKMVKFINNKEDPHENP